jgi:CO/xanthine dehydrogenase FAD-binding subunit
VSVCAALEMENGIVRVGTVALGGVAETAWRARDAEREILNQGLSDDVIQRAAMAATSALNPVGDFRGSAEYRTEMARVLTARVLRGLRG